MFSPSELGGGQRSAPAAPGGEEKDRSVRKISGQPVRTRAQALVSHGPGDKKDENLHHV
jgi:hypothetical protein